VDDMKEKIMAFSFFVAFFLAFIYAKDRRPE
jgi:hypothetical protein